MPKTRGGEEVTERTNRSIKKTLEFEKSGETLSIEITLENVSPDKSTKIEKLLDTLYDMTKHSIF